MEVGTESFEKQEYEPYKPLKIVHPKVVLAMMQLKTLSPYRVVSDKYQPKSGDLRAKAQETLIEAPQIPKEIMRKEISLSLRKSSLLSRRESSQV